MTEQRWLTTGEAAQRLGISSGDVACLVLDGELPGRPASDYSRLLVREVDLEEYLARHPQTTST
ncbi:MAG: helix-turn-helix domain-containing protein [Acidimicrobiales bacterium]|nr:helix-turn-helix domain-containing protein [Acidimicrobiales bacterium]